MTNLRGARRSRPSVEEGPRGERDGARRVGVAEGAEGDVLLLEVVVALVQLVHVGCVKQNRYRFHAYGLKWNSVSGCENPSPFVPDGSEMAGFN